MTESDKKKPVKLKGKKRKGKAVSKEAAPQKNTGVSVNIEGSRVLGNFSFPCWNVPKVSEEEAASISPQELDAFRAAGTPIVKSAYDPVTDVEEVLGVECPLCHGFVSGAVGEPCMDCMENGACAQDRLSGLFGRGVTDLELDLVTIGMATPGPWEVGFGYEQSTPGCFVTGQGRIVAAEQDDTDCVLLPADAEFMARARTRYPALVNAAIELQFGFAKLVQRYREWAAMKSCTPAARELLRKISDDIEKQLAVFDCEHAEEDR